MDILHETQLFLQSLEYQVNIVFSGRKLTSDQTRTVINTELMNGWKMLLVNICSFRGLLSCFSAYFVHRLKIVKQHKQRAVDDQPVTTTNILNRTN